MFMVLALIVVISLGERPAAYALIPPDYLPAGPGDIYMALGDSLATGTEHPDNNDNLPGYPVLLLAHAQVINPALGYENLAVDGETSGSMLAEGGQLDAAIARIQALRAAGQRVGLVTVSIGGNDAVSILLPTNDDPAAVHAAFEANFATILDRLQTALKDDNGVIQGDLLVMDFYNPYPGLPLLNIGELADVWVPRFNTSIHTIAAERSIPVAEVGTAFVGNEASYIFVERPYPTSPLDPELLRKLDYHPRQGGHQTIADELFRVSGYTPAPPKQDRVYLPTVVR
jgi:lysophospholipase L1-like esterase